MSAAAYRLHKNELILPEIDHTKHELSANITGVLFTVMETVTPNTFLLIFQWTRVRITNARAFETAIHQQVAENTESDVTPRNVTMFHKCSDHGCTM